VTSRYDRLGERLAAIGAATIILTFAEVAAIMGPLPTAAWRYDVRWWGGAAAGQYHEAQAMRWKAGYVADRPDFAAETVTFRRVGP
jgi:hypothetical protein